MNNPFDNGNGRWSNGGTGFPFGGNGQNGAPFGNNNAGKAPRQQTRGPLDAASKRVIGITCLVAVLLLILPQCFVVTYPNEYNVIRQFGRITSIREEPGLSVKAPFVTSVTSIPKNLRLYDLPASDVITSDKKSMIVDCYVLWTIRDPRKFIQTLNGNTATAESRIDTIVYNGIKNTISDMTQDEVIQSRDGKITVANNSSELDNVGVDVDVSGLEEIEGEAAPQVVHIVSLTEEIMKNFDDVEDQYGISIETVDVKVLALPDENKEAVYERMIAERNNIAASYTALGDSEAQIIRNAADKEVSILLSEARAKADMLVAEGEAEYMRILSEAYNDADKADFYLFVRSLDAARTALAGGNKTLILDKNSPIAQIFYNMQ